MTCQVLEAGVNKIFTFPIFINSTGVTIQASATFQNKSTSSCKHCHVPIPFLPRRKISISSHPLSLAILLVLLSPWSVLLCSSSGFSMFPFRCGTQALALAGLGHYTTLKLLPLFLWTITLLFMETAFPFTFSFWGHLKLMPEIAIISCKIHLFLEYTARLYFPDYLKLYVAIECILAHGMCAEQRSVRYQIFGKTNMFCHVTVFWFCQVDARTQDPSRQENHVTEGAQIPQSLRGCMV